METKTIVFSGLCSNIENTINAALAREAKKSWTFLDMKVIHTGEGRITEVIVILRKEISN